MLDRKKITWIGAIFVSTSLMTSAVMGQALYDVIPLGLTDPEHVRSDGYVRSWRIFHNESGQVTGRSERHSGMTYIGISSWVYDGTDTSRIGLIDAEHTRSDGYRSSDPRGMNEAGDVLGRSTQYIGTSTRHCLKT